MLETSMTQEKRPPLQFPGAMVAEGPVRPDMPPSRISAREETRFSKKPVLLKDVRSPTRHGKMGHPMDAVNAGYLRTIEQRSHDRLRRLTAAPDRLSRTELSDSLAETRQLTAAAPSPQAPVTRAMSDVVSQVQTYAASLFLFPSAASGAMLQAVTDVEILARLGQKETLTQDDVRQAARATLHSARTRADESPDLNVRTAVVSQGLQDASRTLALSGDTAADLVPRFFDLCSTQGHPQTRSMILQAGAKVLSGVLTVHPQSVSHLSVPASKLPGSVLALSASDRAKFTDLWTHFDRAQVRVNRRFEGESFNVQDELDRLLRSGLTAKVDSHGDTLLADLHQLLTQPMAPGVDRDLILAQTITHVCAPGRSMSQGTKLTCSAATVSYQLAHRRPAEYARLVCGLTSTEGQVRLSSGAVARRIPDSLPEDGSGRSAVERIVQSSLMEVGGTPQGGATYNALVDGYFDGRRQMVQTGMFPAEFAKLEEAVGEGHYNVVDKPSRETILDTVATAGEHVPITLSWEGNEEHWVLARGIEDGRVFFRNPHGHRATDRFTLSTGDHQLHEGGIESLPVDEFVQRTRAILMPT